MKTAYKARGATLREAFRVMASASTQLIYGAWRCLPVDMVSENVSND